MKATLQSYLETMLWAECDEDGVSLDATYGIDDIHSDSVKQAAKDIESFIDMAGDLLDGEDDGQVGHDFWLTRNGHGTGFWDGGYEEEKGRKLTKISKTFGSCAVYIGDEGRVHLL